MTIANKTKHRILVVDDTKTDRDLFKFFIGQSGYEVDTAADGKEALLALSKKEYDLVLCDYLMPQMDGYEFLLEVKSREQLKHMVVIIITSDEAESTKVKLLKAGVNDFIQKGCSPNEILTRIKIHLDAQAGYSQRQILTMAAKLANDLNQPLSVLISALDVLKLKIEMDVPKDNRAELLGIMDQINAQANAITVCTNELRKVGMSDVRVSPSAYKN